HAVVAPDCSYRLSRRSSFVFFFSSRRRHTRSKRDWSSDVCSSDLILSCLITGSGGTSGLFLSLFFAYAWMWPEQRVLLFFILPVKVKWLGWAAGAVWLLEFLFSRLSGRVSLLFGLAGFLLFFGPELYHWCPDTLVSAKRRRDWENRWRQ